jgi:hypothetical protein
MSVSFAFHSAEVCEITLSHLELFSLSIHLDSKYPPHAQIIHHTGHPIDVPIIHQALEVIVCCSLDGL